MAENFVLLPHFIIMTHSTIVLHKQLWEIQHFKKFSWEKKMGGKLPMGNCWGDIFKKGYFCTFERSLLTSVESLAEQLKEQTEI